MIEHNRTVEHREVFRKADWQGRVWRTQHRYVCSCGWSSSWAMRYGYIAGQANAHALSGQLSFDVAP